MSKPSGVRMFRPVAGVVEAAPVSDWDVRLKRLEEDLVGEFAKNTSVIITPDKRRKRKEGNQV